MTVCKTLKEYEFSGESRQKNCLNSLKAKTTHQVERLSDTSNKIQKYVEAKGFRIVSKYVEPSVWQNLHENPDVRYRFYSANRTICNCF